LEIPEAYSKDVKNSVKSYQEFFRWFTNWKNFQRRKCVLQA
jgi:hypothetical protein